MEYRAIDKDKIGLELFKADALQAEQEYFAARCEVARLQDLLNYVEDDEEKEAILAALERMKAAEEKSRKKANRKNALHKVEKEDVDKVKLDFLNAWLENIEKEHATHTASLIAKEAELDYDEDDDAGPDGEERAAIESSLVMHIKALKVLESAWRLVTGKIDALTPTEDHDHDHDH